MKKTKLFTSIAALALVLGLGACDTTSEEETTPDESETTTETSGTSESTPTTPSEDPDGYVLVGDFTDSNWDAKVDTSSKYYIPLGTTEYKATVTIVDEPDYGEWEPWAAGLRVVEWGDSWNLVAGYDELDEGSTGVIGEGDDKNIKVNWGETYDITVTFGETNSILVTLQEEEEEGTSEDDDAVIAEAILDAVNEGISWDAFHGEYIDEGYDERETIYLTEDEDGMYGSIIDSEDDEVTFVYYYQDGKEYEYAANSSAYEVDDQWEDYSDHLDEYIDEQLDGAEDFDLDSDTYELKEYGDGYELIFTTDFMGYNEYEYIYIVDEDFNVTALAYGEYFAGNLEGWYAEETTYDKVETSMADFDVTLWDEEKEETFPYTIGETYWFGYEYSNKLYSFTGAIASSYYGGVTTDTNGAVSVTLGEAEGGYTLSFNDSSTKSTQYIKFVENSSNRNFSFSSEEFVWEYNATYDTFVALDSTNDYVFIGNYYGSSTYDELRVSSIGYLDGTKSSSNTQYPAHLYTQDTPTTLTITGGADSLEIDKTLKLGITTENGASHDVVWTSSNEEAAVVDDYGEVTALSVVSGVTITATSVKSDLVTASITLAITEKSALTYKASETINTSSYYSYVTSASLDLNDAPIVGDLVTISFASNGGSTAPQYYVNGTSVRIYAMNTMTFTPVDESVAKISSIEINYDGSYYGNDAADFTDSTGATAGTISNPKTSGGTITLTVTASGAVTYTNWFDANHSTKSGGTQIRILSFTIYYAQA